MDMRTDDFDYELPPELIAQTPVEPRDSSRMLVVDRETQDLRHRLFSDLKEYLQPGDVIVFNDSRVIPARLKGRKAETGGMVELLLLKRVEDNVWEALAKPGKRVRTGTILEFDNGVTADVISAGEAGLRTVKFHGEGVLSTIGQVALPPYIHTALENPERYQTVYSRESGSVAAPTAGLHFTPELLCEIEKTGINTAFVTLHVGLDTFRPVQEEDPRKHHIHSEYGVLPEATSEAILKAKHDGNKVMCVGTTSVRMVEAAAQASKQRLIEPFSGWVDLFILPGYDFKIVDIMLTNFHLPKSTLLMLVSAFAGKELIDKAYREAVKEKYRFFSFGDATLLL